MLNNVCRPMFGADKPITYHTTAAVVGKTFANVSGNIQSGPNIESVSLPSTFDGGNLQAATCAAKAKPIGVFAYDRAEGEPVPVLYETGAVLPVTAGEALTAGEPVEVGANGKAVKLAAGIKAGTATTTAANGKDCFVRLD